MIPKQNDLKISALIHTQNAQTYLQAVLNSLQWCDEIVVIDMESKDQTVSIAKANGARVVTHQNIGAVDPARAFGLLQVSGDWILAIDADEIVPEALGHRLLDIAQSDISDVVMLSFRNFFFGRELQGAGWSYKDIRVARFFKRGFVSYGTEVHNFIQIAPHARLMELVDKDLAIIHFNYTDVAHFVTKLNKYTDQEALKNYRSPWIEFFYHIPREILGRFILLGGYRDGWVGFYLSFAMAFYRMTSVAKKFLPKEERILQNYKEVIRSVKVKEK